MDDLKLYSKSKRTLDSLIQSVQIFSKDIGMQLGIDKSAILVMKKGKIVKSDGTELPNEEVIKSLEEDRAISIYVCWKLMKWWSMKLRIEWRKSSTEEWGKCWKQN